MSTSKAFQLLVIFMIATLCNLLGLQANAAAPISTYPRQVDLSGNIFSFSMPENFSKDMPAANMVEKLDISDIKKFDDPEYGNIIRRWWDIKAPGFFGNQLGTVMMDISVQRVPENKQKLIHTKPYDITNRLDFMMMIYDQSHQRYDQLNLETNAEEGEANAYHFGCCSLVGETIHSHYRDRVYGGKKWLGYSVAAPLNQLIVGTVLPLTGSTYLELVFTYSPNQNVLPLEFLDSAYLITRPIEESLRVDYVEENSVKKLVEEEWINVTNDDVFANNYGKVLIPLFGPDIHQRIAEGKKAALELQKELEKPLEDE